MIHALKGILAFLAAILKQMTFLEYWEKIEQDNYVSVTEFLNFKIWPTLA